MHLGKSILTPSAFSLVIIAVVFLDATTTIFSTLASCSWALRKTHYMYYYCTRFQSHGTMFCDSCVCMAWYQSIRSFADVRSHPTHSYLRVTRMSSDLSTPPSSSMSGSHAGPTMQVADLDSTILPCVTVPAQEIHERQSFESTRHSRSTGPIILKRLCSSVTVAGEIDL